MHPTALDGFKRMLPPLPYDRASLRVLDVGGADVNGTVHDELRSEYVIEQLDVMDIAPGHGVTIVADATRLETWRELRRITQPGSAEPTIYDLVISTETLEHVHGWRQIVEGAALALRPGGWFIGTCASTGRRPHGARGEHEPPDGEWYQNIRPTELIYKLEKQFHGDIVVEYSRRPEFPTTNDLYWRAQVSR
jgi:SAM-dependent methyltransferase